MAATVTPLAGHRRKDDRGDRLHRTGPDGPGHGPQPLPRGLQPRRARPSRASGAALEDAGATSAASVAELADSADVVFASLPGPAEMRQVGVGDGGLLSALKPGGAWFDLTTNSPTVVHEVHATCKRTASSCSTPR